MDGSAARHVKGKGLADAVTSSSAKGRLRIRQPVSGLDLCYVTENTVVTCEFKTLCAEMGRRSVRPSRARPTRGWPTASFLDACHGDKVGRLGVQGRGRRLTRTTQSTGSRSRASGRGSATPTDGPELARRRVAPDASATWDMANTNPNVPRARRWSLASSRGLMASPARGGGAVQP